MTRKESAKPVQIVRRDQEADLYIYGDLVHSQWYPEETSAWSFSRELKNLAEQGVTRLHVHIDSYGGAISTGWAIYNTLKSFGGEVITYADGFVASAAIYPYLAGQERMASPLSAFYLHQAWISTAGNAEELRKAADDLEILNDLGLEAFAAVGLDREKALELEKAETWLRPGQALELGIVTELTEDGGGDSAQQSVRGRIVQMLTAAPAEEGRERPETAQKAADGARAPEDKDHAQPGGTPAQETANTLRGFFQSFAAHS